MSFRRGWLWRGNPHHPSLDFKKLAGRGEQFSIRVGDHYRVLGHKISGGFEWVWIGPTRNTTNLWVNHAVVLLGGAEFHKLPRYQQVTLKVLRWEERDKRLVIKEGEMVA
jgi:hypothetical protein